MDESELQDVLRAADRPRSTTPDERRRLRSALNRSTTEHDQVDRDTHPSADMLDAASVTATRPPPLAPSPGDVAASRTRTRRPEWLILGSAAAVVVVALGLFAVARDGPDSVNVVAATAPAPSTSAEVRELCAGPIAALDTAVGHWGSVADWTVALDGHPDLAALTADALAELASLDPDLQTLADEIRDIVAERASFDLPPGPVIDDHAVALRAGLVGVIETVARFDPERVCDLPAIRAELAGG